MRAGSVFRTGRAGDLHATAEKGGSAPLVPASVQLIDGTSYPFPTTGEGRTSFAAWMRSSPVSARLGNARQSASGRSLERRSEKVKPGCPSRGPVSRTSSWIVLSLIFNPSRSMRNSSSRSCSLGRANSSRSGRAPHDGGIRAPLPGSCKEIRVSGRNDVEDRPPSE